MIYPIIWAEPNCKVLDWLNRVQTGKYEYNLRTFQGLLKASPTVFKDLKLMKNTDRSVKILLQKCYGDEIMETLVLENEYKIVVPIFGAAYAASNIGTTILYWLSSISTVLSPTENSRFKAFEWFSVLFKAGLIFKDFSRKPSKFKYFSSLCVPCWTVATDLWYKYQPFVH